MTSSFGRANIFWYHDIMDMISRKILRCVIPVVLSKYEYVRNNII